MDTVPVESRFPVSLYATPGPTFQEVFYTVPRAGHLVGGSGHRIVREHFPGHELILCLRGEGYVKAEGRRRPVKGGQWVWVNCQLPHEYGAQPRDPWEVYWVRVEGPRLQKVSEWLGGGGGGGASVFDVVKQGEAEAAYRQVFRWMQEGASAAPGWIHAEVARLIALVFEARQLSGGPDSEQLPAVLERPLEHMRLFYFQPQRVAELAAMSGMSAAHFSRLFRASLGTSPIDWLRRERINQAKRRLAEGDDQIQTVAEQVGYTDRFFFSKDFRQMVGMSPKEFRARERTRL
jgi:AraC-like DNA-binding protein